MTEPSKTEFSEIYSEDYLNHLETKLGIDLTEYMWSAFCHGHQRGIENNINIIDRLSDVIDSREQTIDRLIERSLMMRKYVSFVNLDLFEQEWKSYMEAKFPT